jgi:putative Mg2+ transporter-C (MgtC) family protein
MAALPDLPEIAARLSWALLLGSVVGFERQWHQKMAGLKTNALVATGAAGFVSFATLAGQGNPSTISAQIVTGIGFLGAGVIMREGISVHGLNTAATLWCSAMVGAMCGFGMWQAGGVAACLVLGANIVLRPVANWLNTRRQAGSDVESHYTVTLICASGEAPRVRVALLAGLRQRHLPADHLESEAQPAESRTVITVRATTERSADADIEAILGELALDGAVKGTSWQVARASPEA